MVKSGWVNAMRPAGSPRPGIFGSASVVSGSPVSGSLGSRDSAILIYFAIKRIRLLTPNCGLQSPAGFRRYNPQRAPASPHHRLAGLRGVCDHPIILAGHSFARRLLAHAETFPVSLSDTAVDRDVDRCRRGDRFLARGRALLDCVGLATRDAPLGCRVRDIQALRSRLQRCPARRPSRTHRWTSRTTPRHIGDTRTSSPSDLSGAFVRDAGLEPGDGAGGLLWTHDVRRYHRRGHDSIGRSGTGAAVWGRVPRLSAEGASGCAQDMGLTKLPRRYNRI